MDRASTALVHGALTKTLKRSGTPLVIKTLPSREVTPFRIVKCARNPIVNHVVVKVSKNPVGAPNPCLQSILTTRESASDFKHFDRARFILYCVCLVEMFAIATTFQDFTSTVELKWLEQ